MKNDKKRIPKKLWIAVAIVCLILLLIVAAVLLCGKNEKILTSSPVEWTATYNQRNPLSANVDGIVEGLELKLLSNKQIKILTPNQRMTWMKYSGTVSFVKGAAMKAYLEVTTRENTVRIDIGSSGLGSIYERLDTDEYSVCQGVQYYLYQYPYASGTTVEALVTIGETPFVFHMDTDQPDRDIPDFEAVLACFTCYDSGDPQLSKLKP